MCLLSHWIFTCAQDKSDQTSQAICPYIPKLNVIFCYIPGLFHIRIYLWAEIIYICIKKCRNLLSLRFVRGGEDVFHDLWWARFSSIEHSSMQVTVISLSLQFSMFCMRQCWSQNRKWIHSLFLKYSSAVNNGIFCSWLVSVWVAVVFAALSITQW